MYLTLNSRADTYPESHKKPKFSLFIFQLVFIKIELKVQKNKDSHMSWLKSSTANSPQLANFNHGQTCCSFLMVTLLGLLLKFITKGNYCCWAVSKPPSLSESLIRINCYIK